MKAITDDPIVFSNTRLVCGRTSLPEGLTIGEVELGKGSNNRVVDACWDGRDCVIRMPRRRSDTQQKDAAMWEFRHTLKASQLGAAPRVYGAWYAKHARRNFPSGLYLVTERFTHDLEDVLTSERRRDAMLRESDRIGADVLAVLSRIAAADMFLYDLKPSNVVINPDEPSAVRVIDFGREFCEWAGTGERNAATPIVDMVDRMVEGDVARRRHVLLAAMLVELAATTTHRLHSDRHHHRMDRTTREAINGVARVAARFLDSMQGRNVALLREVLRTDQVRGVLAHYHGRRSSGTRRTLRLARGREL